jgi:hypothetical protein
MKMRCECGAIITDQTDDLPYKAYFIPDQDWNGFTETIDQIVGAVAAGNMTTHDAETAVRQVYLAKSRSMYQCSKCGRLLVIDVQGNANNYAPTLEADSRQILKSREDQV